MNHVIVSSVLAGVAGAVGSALVVPVAAAWYRRRGWLDEPGGRKDHQASIPLAGGLAVFAGLLAGVTVAVWLQSAVGAEVDPGGPAGPGDAAGRGLAWPGRWGVGLAVVSLFLVGWWDDVRELGPGIKLGGQMAAGALAVVVGGVHLPLFAERPLLQGVVSVVFFLSAVNALNFLDNMNGLCAGLGCIAAVQLASIGCQLGVREAVPVAGALAGACLGFLPRNYPRATVFLGDSGSLTIGGLLAILAMMMCEAAGRWGTGSASGWAPLWVLAVPAVDLVQVTVGRLRRGQPVYVGDQSHVSHLLVRWGWSRTMAVGLLWLTAALAGLLGVFLTGRSGG